MRLKLISPRRQERDLWDMRNVVKLIGKKYSLPSLALPTLAALTPMGVDVSITDENVDPIDFEERVDLVGISFNTPQTRRAYEIADAFRDRGVSVVLGGIHASMLPEEAARHADALVLGEADKLWPALVNDFCEGKLKERYTCSELPSLTELVVPRWDLLKTNLYVMHPIQTTRGCPYNCDFCSVTAFSGRHYRSKPVENVIEEVKTLRRITRNQGGLFFVDDNFIANPEYTKSFLRALAPLEIKFWWGQSSIRLTQDEELLDLMAEAGCERVLIGFESLSQKNLNRMGKGGVNKAKEYESVIEKIYSRGISIVGAFVLGFDCDDETVFENTVQFIMDHHIAFPQITILTPFPGTKLYERMEQEGRILHKDWSKYTTSTVCFQPALMSPEFLQNGYEWVLQQLFAYPNIYKRLCALWAQNVRTKQKFGLFSPFTGVKLILSLKSLASRDVKEIKFVLKSLWQSDGADFPAVLWALGLHDFAYHFSTATSPRLFGGKDI